MVDCISFFDVLVSSKYLLSEGNHKDTERHVCNSLQSLIVDGKHL